MEQNIKDSSVKFIEKAYAKAYNLYNEISFNQDQAKKFVLVVSKCFNWSLKQMNEDMKSWNSIGITLVHEHTQCRVYIDKYQGKYRVKADIYQGYFDDRVKDELRNIYKEELGFKFFTHIGNVAGAIGEIIGDGKAIQRILTRIDKTTIPKLKKMTSERARYLFQKSLKISFET